jgi:soluble lytic murein transglycosylase
VEVSGPAPSENDMAAVKRVIEIMRTGNRADALRLADAIEEPVSRKLAEWIVLRFDDNFIGFQRYANFVNANPTWPSVSTFRRRAEATLWQEKADNATIKGYFASNEPLTAKGRLAYARALLASGDSAGAQTQVREAWRSESMSADMEAQVRDQFGPFISAGDDKARMEERLYANDSAAGLRSAQRLNNTQLAIARARTAVTSKAGNARALVNAVPHDAHNDAGYQFAHVQMLRREDKFAEAARVMASVTRDAAQLHNTDEWWIERRLLARKLLDVNDAKTAYVVARDAPMPDKEVYRIEREFTAGWIALRFLHDHQAAIAHFAKIPQVTANPISLARAGYWLGRSLDAAGRPQDARRQYETAARWTTTYYGQMARAKLGLGEMVLYAPQASQTQRGSVERLELVRAAEILYALDEPNLIRPLMADLGERLEDIGALTALGEIAARQKDARSMVLLGKAALARGYPFGQYAFPTVGVPDYTPVGPKIDPALVFSIMRQESGFDPKIVSPAKAMGLMQVTPVAGRDTCKRFKCSFDANRLLNDPTYNLQIGSAELAGVLSDYRGSYIMTFAAYNAGRGSVREWVARYGDPRDPGVDAVDWVERIPFSETRNYVQRVMENLQVYRVRFGGTSKLLIEADLKRGGETN